MKLITLIGIALLLLITLVSGCKTWYIYDECVSGCQEYTNEKLPVNNSPDIISIDNTFFSDASLSDASLEMEEPIYKLPRIQVDCEIIKNISVEFGVYYWTYTDCAMLEVMIYETTRLYFDNETTELKSEYYYANLKVFNKSFYEYGICYIIKNQSIGFCKDNKK